jgi:hypothetical protein
MSENRGDIRLAKQANITSKLTKGTGIARRRHRLQGLNVGYLQCDLEWRNALVS